MDSEDIKKIGREVLTIEYKSVEALVDRIDGGFVDAVRLLHGCRGRVIVTGIGKSGFIGNKISATLSSTGTPSFFLHAAEGVHGDLGVVTPEDVVIAISYSGETEEILKLVPFFKRFGVSVVSLTGGVGSQLATLSDVVIDTGVEKEACPMNLAPTASTTSVLAMGDAIAVALLKMRDFKEEDFALFHPGGRLGRSLLLRVEDIMHSGDSHPCVSEGVELKEAICEMTKKGLGITSITASDGTLSGVLTDGDLRRIFESDDNPLALPVETVMKKNPKAVSADLLAVEALRIMEDNSITSIIVVDDDKKPQATIHIHDILRAGIV
jgi:arabinose-5-phosphate isomerase